MTEIILVQVADGRQMIKRDVFSVIRIKISLDMCTFLAWVLCSDQFKRRICDPLKLKDQNIKHMSADFFVPFRLIVQFLKQSIKVKKQICFLFSAVKDTIFFLIIKRER